MELNLTIDGRQVPFKSTAAFILRYKAQFGRDAIRDLSKLQKMVKEKDKDKEKKKDENDEDELDLDALDLQMFYEMVWVMAKAADPTIPPPLDWLDTFSEFPLLENLETWMEMMTKSFTTTKSIKKK
ncbi:hypothetical protein [Acidaminobacter sp.]|uniref:hypothetical protein n=1 Tax=Acidaminobacter sp. TaxID=1872102 RepID=UPI00255D4602|nr:hypothetical protein [Acidaminobacter sp.]MDK9712311.1 hypothetical protein [Acidaminobacter sp.]